MTVLALIVALIVAVGLRAAIAAYQAGVEVMVVGKSQRRDAHTVLASCGINAVLGSLDPQDRWEQHFADTVNEAYHLSNPRMVEILVQEAPAAVLELADWGCKFARTEDGKLDQRYFGAHKYRRTCYAGDYTGREILRTLDEKVATLEIPIIEITSSQDCWWRMAPASARWASISTAASEASFWPMQSFWLLAGIPACGGGAPLAATRTQETGCPWPSRPAAHWPIWRWSSSILPGWLLLRIGPALWLPKPCAAKGVSCGIGKVNASCSVTARNVWSSPHAIELLWRYIPRSWKVAPVRMGACSWISATWISAKS